MKKNYLIILMVLALFLTSCANDNNDNIIEEENLGVSGDYDKLLDRSEGISDVVVELFGIDDAVTIVFNEYALIAVKIAYNEDMTQEQATEISNKVKDYDEVGEVLITDNSRVFKEIDDIIFGLLQGDPYEDFLDDINGIKIKLSNDSF